MLNKYRTLVHLCWHLWERSYNK